MHHQHFVADKCNICPYLYLRFQAAADISLFPLNLKIRGRTVHKPVTQLAFRSDSVTIRHVNCEIAWKRVDICRLVMHGEPL